MSKNKIDPIEEFAEQMKEEARIHGYAVPVTQASKGFFIAKRQMQETLDNRVCTLRQSARVAKKEGRFADASLAVYEAEIIEGLRDYVRNGMLWNSDWGK